MMRMAIRMLNHQTSQMDVPTKQNKMNLDFIQTKSKKPAKRYIKPDSIKKLQQLHFAAKQKKYPNNPYPVKTKFRDDTANGLTKCIGAWLSLHGHFAGRVNTQGNYNQKLGKWTKSGSKQGMADITAVINGRHVSIEIKIGKDKIRPNQEKCKSEIEAAGGVYIIASSFDNFLEQIRSL